MAFEATRKKFWRYANRWLWQTPERALDTAYNAVLEIKRLENEYFGGQQISLSANYSESVVNYLQAELYKYLRIARSRLTEFKVSSFIRNLSSMDSSDSRKILDTLELEQKAQAYDGPTIEIKAVTSVMIGKLNFIDETLVKYKNFNIKKRTEINLSSPKNSLVGNRTLVKLNKEVTPKKAKSLQSNSNNLMSEKKPDSRSSLEKTSFIPRSIGRTLEKLKRELAPNAELEVIKEFRSSRDRTVASIRYLLILILLPLLLNQVSRIVVFDPLIENFWTNNQLNIFLNSSQEERAFAELKSFEKKIRFESLIGKNIELSPEALENKLKEKANELAHQYRTESADVVKNIFADILSLATFIAIIVIGKRQLATLKSFIDELVYGLSDSAKAFLIILLTDMFVGFHSSHGWEVILENTLTHFGLPENKNFISLFIATFPVMLDSLFKYWIFRYLNRISPSAVATYRDMNE